MPATVRSRLLSSYILIIVICLAVTGIMLSILLVPQVTRLTYLRLAEKALPAALRVLSLRSQGLSPEETLQALGDRTALGGTRLLIVNSEGQVLADSEGTLGGRQLNLPAPEGSKIYSQGRVLTREGLFYYVAVPSTLRARANQDSSPPAWYAVLLSQPRQVLTTLLGEISLGFIVTGGVALAVSVGVALVIARSIGEPLQRITTATEEIARGNYEEQLDITSPEEMRRLATSFNTMAREVKASRQAQRDFVANVSHDLKTPLTSIQGFSQAILDGTAGDEPSHQRAAQVINEEAERMAHLVDSLLDLARMEAGQVVMSRESVPVAALLKECAEMIALRAEQAGLRVEVATEGDPVVSGDRDRLAQVVSNLLDNALQHTPSGGRITLAAKSVAPPGGKRGEKAQAYTEITVSDTGEGIPPEDLPRIFERFYRGDKSRAKGGRGTGLGLAIAREIVRAHGGEIKAESVVGLGTKFSVTLSTYTAASL